jgi:hypothetical protein
MSLTWTWGATADAGLDCASTWLPDQHLARLLGAGGRPSGRRLEGGGDEFGAARASSDVVITGGLGGLGLSISAWLRDSGGSRLILTSRSGRVARGGQGLQEMLTELLREPYCVTVWPCDSSESANVASLLYLYESTTGLMHMPHVLKDRMVRVAEAEDIPHVLSAKAIGARHLHHALSTKLVSFALMFCSSATYGGLGIASHCSANMLLDTIATYARALGLQKRALTVPIILGVGAGAAVALAAGSNAVTAAMSLTVDQFIRCVQLCMCSATSDVCGPFQSDINPLNGLDVPLGWFETSSSRHQRHSTAALVAWNKLGWQRSPFAPSMRRLAVRRKVFLRPLTWSLSVRVYLV